MNKNGIFYDKPIGWFIKNYMTEYQIVLPEKSLVVEDYAGQELKNYLKKATGAYLDVVKDDIGAKLGDKIISIGNTRFLKEAGLDVRNLNCDGFKIKTLRSTILICGETGRGTLYGVYEFLERMFGIRFLTCEVEYIPPQKTIVPLYEMDITEIPEFRLRLLMAYNFEINHSLAFFAKTRMLSQSCGNASAIRYGGGYPEEWNTANMHTWDYYALRDKYVKEHPDWFVPITEHGVNDGQIHYSHGLNDDGTIDETQEDSLIKHIIERIKLDILERPEIRYIALGQNDNKDYCRGDACNGKCVRQRELFGGHSAHSIVWANAIAREITKWAKEQGIEREFQFVIFAYMHTETPPDRKAPLSHLAVPDKNVCIEICPYNPTNYNVPIKDKKHNPYFYELFEEWKAITNNFFVFDYARDFLHYITWYPHFNVIKPNLEYYKELGAFAVATNGLNGVYQGRLVHWLLSKLEWNLKRDVNALIAEFNECLFGVEAGKIISEWVEYTNAHFEKAAQREDGSREHLPCYGVVGNSYHLLPSTLTIDFLQKSYAMIEKAREVVKADSKLTETQRKQRLKDLLSVEVQVDYMKHVNYDYLFSQASEEQKLEFYRNLQSKLSILEVHKLANGGHMLHSTGIR